MNCRWKDKSGNHRYEPSFRKSKGLLLLKMRRFQTRNPEKRESGKRGDRLTRELCITTTVAMYMNGSLILSCSLQQPSGDYKW